MKRSLLLDVDGVVADFHNYLLERVGHEPAPGDLATYDVFSILTPEQRELAYEYLRDPSFWLCLPLIDGAFEGVLYLDGMGYDITWVTAPWEGCEGWRDARKQWLDEKFGMSMKGHHFIPTASKEKVVGDVLIDDKPGNVSKWSDAHPTKTAYLFDQPYNQSFHWPYRFTWDKARECL